MTSLKSVKEQISQSDESNSLTPMSGLYLRETLLDVLELSMISEVSLSHVFDMQYPQISKVTKLSIQVLNIDVKIEGFDLELMPEEIYPDKRTTGH